MIRFIIGLLLVSNTTCILSQQIPIVTQSPISSALSGCDVSQPQTISSGANAASLASNTKFATGIVYEQRYNISQLSTKGITAIAPFAKGVVGANVVLFGFNTYQSTNYALSYSRTFGSKVSAGIQFNLRDEYQLGTEHVMALYGNVGLIYHPSEILNIGLNITNPQQAHLSYQDQDVPIATKFEVGIGYKIIESTTIFSEIEQELGLPTDVSLAIETNFKSKLFLRAGYKITQNKFSWGLGAHCKAILLDLGCSYQTPLGLISSISLLGTFGK